MTSPTASQPIGNLSLSDLRDQFALKRDRSYPFFKEWFKSDLYQR